ESTLAALQTAFDAALSSDSTNTGTGGIHWTFALPNDATQQAPAGGGFIATYQVAVNDGHATGTQNVTITVGGQNDAPAIQDDNVTISRNEGDGSVTQHLTVQDDLFDTDVWTVVCGSGVPHPAQYSFQIDNFKISRLPGQIVFDDAFSDGVP